MVRHVVFTDYHIDGTDSIPFAVVETPNGVTLINTRFPEHQCWMPRSRFDDQIEGDCLRYVEVEE